MSLPDVKHNLTKLSLEELDELFEREHKILNNKKIINHLPDKGKQVKVKLEKIEKELKLRRDIENIEGSMKTLKIDGPKSEVLKEKHVQHICNIEKSPKKERYKPFSTLVKIDEKKTEKPTQLITLSESITLLMEQANKLPVVQIRRIEGTEVKPKPEEQGEDEKVVLYNDAEDSDESENK